MLKTSELAYSGQVCLRSGLWVSLGPEKESRELREGDVFPEVDGRRTRWKFLLHLVN